MNFIQDIREEIRRYFNPDGTIENSEETILSPNRNFKVQTKSYKQDRTNCNWEVTKVEIFDEATSNLLFSFMVNEGTFFHSWVIKDKKEYLLCAEDLCGGQTVIDFANKKMSSYSANEDGFIWTKHLLSPNEKFLAVFGCGWGSAFFIVVYHFDNPLELPLKIAYEPDWTGYDMIEWIDDKNIKVKPDSETESILTL